ncbi:hypothetical protein [Jonesia quinghaiensis]|uniref:hypothetical protein n=1 Tax=Jonesia quinghaiensis TaxID=262806 RepID=UPI0003FBB488|nr:hypothetical protein [Jonesia quinghaiensis]
MIKKFLRWAFAPVPLARVAVFRVIIYSFIIWDIFTLTNDVIPHGYAPEFYDPLWIGRWLPFPEPTVLGAIIMQWALVVSCIVAASGFFSRTSGWAVAILFLAWMENSQGFSYVSHDHMALMVTTWVLPTVGRAGFRDLRVSEAAGWALRITQFATVVTYFGSVFAKIASNGYSFIAWPNSSVFTWAFMRRGSELVTWTLAYPWLLKTAQWGLYIIEILSIAVFWLRGKWQYAFISLFFVFHLATYLALGIHFLPTVVCWLAFFPLERIATGVALLWGKIRHRTGNTANAVSPNTPTVEPVEVESGK